MELSIKFIDENNSLRLLTPKHKVGKGKFDVFKVYSSSDKLDYALKIFPNTMLGNKYYQQEQIRLKMSHPHIIKSIPMMCSNDEFKGLLTELGTYGDLYNFVMNEAFQSEILIRTYFHQLI